MLVLEVYDEIEFEVFEKMVFIFDLVKLDELVVVGFGDDFVELDGI